jgi:hypothetical protein
MLRVWRPPVRACLLFSLADCVLPIATPPQDEEDNEQQLYSMGTQSLFRLAQALGMNAATAVAIAMLDLRPCPCLTYSLASARVLLSICALRGRRPALSRRALHRLCRLRAQNAMIRANALACASILCFD